MRFSLVSTTILTFTSLASAYVTPSSNEYEVDLTQRDLDLSSIASSLLDGHIVSNVISHFDYEKVAGYADDILNENNNVKYLDKALVVLKDSNIIPKLAVKLVTDNSTLVIVKKTLPILMSVAGKLNATSIFSALDRSGLAYSVVAGAIEDTDFLPSVLNVSKKLIKSSKLNFTSILDTAGKLVESKVTRDLALEQIPEESIYDLIDLERRDNVEDLLVTVMSSVKRSGLVNETVSTVLSDSDFQDGAVVLMQGVFEDIGSEIKGVDFSDLKPILTALKNSGLLQHTLERALKDQDLRNALQNDLGGLLKNGTIKETDLVSKKELVNYNVESADRTISATADASAINSVGANFQSFVRTKTTAPASNSNYPSESTGYSATAKPSSTSSGSSGASGLIDSKSNSLMMTLMAGLLGFVSVVLI